MSESLVSICCLTYNHEPYIRQCIEGFIMQKTNFLFEVLIHDDASTDNTATIIREYEAKFPDIIKPIYQTENQYSKGVGVTRVYQFPRAKGKYIAMCEGDDYWTDPLKLQKQVDFLETNENFVFSGHDVEIKNEAQNLIIGKYQLFKNIIELKDTVLGPPVHTSSLVYRNGSLEFPKSSFKLPAGDDAMECLLASKGKGFSFNEAMSVYRLSSVGSWSTLSQIEKDYKTLVIQLWIIKNYPIQLKAQTGKIYDLVNSVGGIMNFFSKGFTLIDIAITISTVLLYKLYFHLLSLKNKIFRNVSRN